MTHHLGYPGVQDILIACVDGLTGFPEAVETAYPKTQVQLCIVHMVRNSLKYVSWKHRKAVAADLKTIYSAPNVEAAEQALAAFEAKYQDRFPQIGRSWRSCWINIIPFFSYPPEIRPACRRQEGYLYHQRHRINAGTVAKGDPESRLVSHGRLGKESDLSGITANLEEMEAAHQGLGRRPESLQHYVRGKDLTIVNRPACRQTGRLHKIPDTPQRVGTRGQTIIKSLFHPHARQYLLHGCILLCGAACPGLPKHLPGAYTLFLFTGRIIRDLNTRVNRRQLEKHHCSFAMAFNISEYVLCLSHSVRNSFRLRS